MKKTFMLMLALLTVPLFFEYAAASTYVITPGDVLEISVWKDESLSRELTVPPDGVISFPLIGDVDTRNLTVPQLRKIVRQKLSEYIPDATVTVMLLSVNSLKAYVIGKVNKPGEFEITLDTSVMQLLAKAGGLNPFASAGSIYILRQTKDGNKKISFNYGRVESGKSLEQNIRINRGDVIVVP